MINELYIVVFFLIFFISTLFFSILTNIVLNIRIRKKPDINEPNITNYYRHQRILQEIIKENKK